MDSIFEHHDIHLCDPLTSISKGLCGWQRVSHRILNLEDQIVEFVYVWQLHGQTDSMMDGHRTEQMVHEIMGVPLQHHTMHLSDGKQVTGVLTAYLAGGSRSCMCMCCVYVCTWKKNRSTHAPGPCHVHVTVSCGEEGGGGNGWGLTHKHLWCHYTDPLTPWPPSSPSLCIECPFIHTLL